MKKPFLLLFISIFFLSCASSGDEDEIVNPFLNISFNVDDRIDQLMLTYIPQEAQDNPIIQWSTSEEDIEIQYPTNKTAYIIIPETTEEKNISIKLTVKNELFEGSTTQTITLPILSEIRKKGLGRVLNEEKSNNVHYDWYFDQAFTGTYSSINCGPSAATMAIKWVYQDFSKTPEDARKAIHPNGGWWYTNNVTSYLNWYNVSNHTIPLSDISLLKKVIDEGNIAILCLDMFYISMEKNGDHHIDRFYQANNPEWGHSILVKGYKKVDNVMFYEVYDPYSYNRKYNNGVLKGIDRYYRETNLRLAAQFWWKYAIVISKDDNSSLRSTEEIDINTIPHMPCR